MIGKDAGKLSRASDALMVYIPITHTIRRMAWIGTMDNHKDYSISGKANTDV